MLISFPASYGPPDAIPFAQVSVNAFVAFHFSIPMDSLRAIHCDLLIHFTV